MGVGRDTKHRIEDFTRLRDSHEDLREMITQLGLVYSLPKARVQIALTKLDDALAIVHGRGGRRDPKRLKESELKRLNVLVQDMHKEGRAVFLLMLKEDGTGLMDMMTGKTFNFE